ncbi:MAG: SxtJ family membrane protein [Gemmatimonadota bacterium]|nr:SxtJ family membrane protein [Gemmatimonadota bacterium]
MSDHANSAPLIRTDRWASSLAQDSGKGPSMRIFGVVMLVGFGVLGGLSLLTWRRTGAPWRLVAGYILVGLGGAIFLWSLVAPRSLPPVYRAWMALGQGMGTVVSTVLLGVLYYVVVTPVGLLMRVTGTDPVERRVTRGDGSYWKVHDKPDAAADYEHMA